MVEKVLNMLGSVWKRFFFARRSATTGIDINTGLMATLESVEEQFFSYDVRNKKMLYISPTCAKIFGHNQRAFHKNPQIWFEQVVEADKKKFENAFAILKQGQVFRCEYRIVRNDGFIRWLESKVRPVLDKKGWLIRLDGISADITRRKETEEDLRNMQQRLLASQRIAGVGSWELYLADYDNLKAGTLRWSDETFRILGYAPGEVESTVHLFHEHVHPDDREMVTRTLKEAVRERSHYDTEYRIVRHDGTLCLLRSIGELVYCQDNKVPQRMIGTVQDITSQRTVETALRQAETNLRNIFQNTESSYLLLDAAANVLAYNPPAEKLFGRLGMDLKIGTSYFNLVHEERRNWVRETIAQVLSLKSTMKYDVKLPAIDGDDIWVSVTMHAITNEAGNVTGVAVASRDITVKKNYEEQIKKSNERYELVLKATNDLIWDWQLAADTIYRSENFSKILGGRTYENNSSGMNWVDYVHEDDRERVVEGIFKKLVDPGAHIWEDEYRYVPVGSQPVFVKDRGLIIRDEKMEAIRMVGAMRDITSEKLLQIEKDRITADLVHRNKDLEQFTYIVSHNLRAPVANILGLGALLQRTDMDAETFKNCINGLLLSTNLLNNIIIDLNHILQVRNAVTEKREVVDLKQLLADIKVSIAHLLEKEKATIDSDFTEVSNIFSLKSYLHSIFYNLVINSIKYKKEGERPHLKIWTRHDNGNVIMHFKDNGAGIDLRMNAQKIFGLYKRFHFHVEGKGLGLFMVKTQVEALGGKILVESEIGKGTEFIVHLPENQTEYSIDTLEAGAINRLEGRSA